MRHVIFFMAAFLAFFAAETTAAEPICSRLAEYVVTKCGQKDSFCVVRIDFADGSIRIGYQRPMNKIPAILVFDIPIGNSRFLVFGTSECRKDKVNFGRVETRDKTNQVTGIEQQFDILDNRGIEHRPFWQELFERALTDMNHFLRLAPKGPPVPGAKPSVPQAPKKYRPPPARPPSTGKIAIVSADPVGAYFLYHSNSTRKPP